MDHSNLCSGHQQKSPSESSLLTVWKMDKTTAEKSELIYDLESDNEENKDVLCSSLILNKNTVEKGFWTPKSTDTLFEIPDMPNSAGSSFCRSATSSTCSIQSTIFSENTEIQSSDIECDVCSSTLTLVSQSYAPSESTSPALRCSIPRMDDTILVILDSATAILQLPTSVTRCSTDCLVNKQSINGDKLLNTLKDTSTSSPMADLALPFSNSVSPSIIDPIEERSFIAESKIPKPEVIPRCKMRDYIQNKSHQTATVPMYLVEMLPGQFMAFPTDMPGPLGPNPTPVLAQIEPSLPFAQMPDTCEQMLPRLRQPIPLYHTIIDSEPYNKFQNEINNNSNKVNSM